MVSNSSNNRYRLLRIKVTCLAKVSCKLLKFWPNPSKRLQDSIQAQCLSKRTLTIKVWWAWANSTNTCLHRLSKWTTSHWDSNSNNNSSISRWWATPTKLTRLMKSSNKCTPRGTTTRWLGNNYGSIRALQMPTVKWVEIAILLDNSIISSQVVFQVQWITTSSSSSSIMTFRIWVWRQIKLLRHKLQCNRNNIKRNLNLRCLSMKLEIRMMELIG